jgi:hypothetical protein
VYELSEIYGDERFPVINWFPFFCKRYLEIKCFQLQWFKRLKNIGLGTLSLFMGVSPFFQQ